MKYRIIYNFSLFLPKFVIQFKQYHRSPYVANNLSNLDLSAFLDCFLMEKSSSEQHGKYNIIFYSFWLSFSYITIALSLEQYHPWSYSTRDSLPLKLLGHIFSYSIATRSSNIVSLILFVSPFFLVFLLLLESTIQVTQYHASNDLWCDL